MKLIKIENNIFEYLEGSCQLSIGSHASLYYTFNISNHPSYKDFFFKNYDDKKVFNIIATKYIAHGTQIKSIDLDTKRNIISVSMKCQILEEFKPNERREDILEDLLNPTFNSDGTINNNS